MVMAISAMGYPGGGGENVAAKFNQKYGNGYTDFGRCPKFFEYPMDTIPRVAAPPKDLGFFQKLRIYLRS